VASFIGVTGSGRVPGTTNVLTFVTTRTIEAGEHVVVLTANNGGSANTSTITVGSLSLARDLNGPFSFSHHELWSASATSQIASGSTVTVTLPFAVSICIHAICASLAGIKETGYFGVSPTAANSPASTGVSGTTSVPPEDGGIAIAGLRIAAGATTATVNGGFTPSGGEISNDNNYLELDYKALGPAAAQGATWTYSAGTPGSDGLIGVYTADTASNETIAVPYTRSSGPVGRARARRRA
jgi:hypothetical protein